MQLLSHISFACKTERAASRPDVSAHAPGHAKSSQTSQAVPRAFAVSFVLTVGVAVGAQLFSHREDVDAVNAAQLAALPGDAVRFAAQDDGRTPDALQAACPVRCLGFKWVR